MAPKKLHSLFVAWTKFTRRPLAMQPYFGYELIHVRPRMVRRWLKPVDYIVSIVVTTFLLARKKPHIFWMQLPPTFLLYVACVYRLLRSERVVLIADCHNSMLRPFWLSLPFARKCLKLCDVIIFHNEEQHHKALQLGLPGNRIVILEDKVPDLENRPGSADLGTKSVASASVLMPCSFDADEPIRVVYEAARLAREIVFLLSGDYRRARGRHDLRNPPPNLILTGFLPVQRFNELIGAVDVVLGLTIDEGVQLGCAAEAISANKPMVLSDTHMLRKLYPIGTVFVDANSPESVSTGCREAIRRKVALRNEIYHLREMREPRWNEQARLVKEAVKGFHPPRQETAS